MTAPTPILGFAAFSGTGKTTLLAQVIPLLRQAGLRLGLIKHTHHTFEIDTPGKDSYKLRHAGASQVVVASTRRTVFITDHSTVPSWETRLQWVDSASLDLIVVEGFKYRAMPKIELYRPSLSHPLLCLTDPTVIAVATDAPLPHALTVPLLDLNDPPAVAAFVRQWLRTAAPAP